jgi:hypothetical protein
VPGFGGDAGITEALRIVGHTVDHVGIDVEHLPVGVVRIVRLGRSAEDVDIRMGGATTATATQEVRAPGYLRIAGDGPVGGPVELDPPPKVAQSGPQKDWLLQFSEIPDCHVSWLAPPP